MDKVFLYHQLQQKNKYKKQIKLHAWLFITATVKNVCSLLPFEGMVNVLYGQCIVYRNAHIKSWSVAPSGKATPCQDGFINWNIKWCVIIRGATRQHVKQQVISATIFPTAKRFCIKTSICGTFSLLSTYNRHFDYLRSGIGQDFHLGYHLLCTYPFVF